MSVVAGLSDPTGSRVDSEPADVDQSSTVFDKVGGEQQAEPQREMPDSRPQVETARAERAPAVGVGDFFVQVIALTDQLVEDDGKKGDGKKGVSLTDDKSKNKLSADYAMWIYLIGLVVLVLGAVRAARGDAR